MGEDDKDPPRASSGLNKIIGGSDHKQVFCERQTLWPCLLQRERILGYRRNAGIPKPSVRSYLCLSLGSHKETPSQDFDI